MTTLVVIFTTISNRAHPIPSISITDLKRIYGIPQDDIDLAIATQQAQRKAGCRVQSISEICGVTKAQGRRRSGGGPVRAGDGTDEFTKKALRHRGGYDQAALLIEQTALSEDNPERAAVAREAAQSVKELSQSQKIEWDFFKGGNVSTSRQYHTAVRERLRESGVAVSRQNNAMAVLYEIITALRWQRFECEKTAKDLCEVTGLDRANMSRILKLLEDVGAIRRVRRGRENVITVNPEAAYRGDVNNHAKVTELYSLEVIDGGHPA